MYIKLLGLLLGLVLVVAMGSILFNECQNGSEGLTELKEGKLILYQGNSIRASVIPAWFKPQVYGSLIDCLAFYESSHNPEAIGDYGKAYGILQFWESTFEMYAKMYNLKLDYKNPEDQKLLADYMLQDNFGNIIHWSSYKNCLK